MTAVDGNASTMMKLSKSEAKALSILLREEVGNG
jgi:hypothetical protein